MSQSLTRLCLIRHGETAWNAERRIQGQIDIELNTQGQRQAELAGLYLRSEGATALYASDLKRAWATAAHISQVLGLKAVPVPELRERRYGIFEGLTYDDARRQHADVFAKFESRDPAYAIPGDGESLRDMYARITDCIQRIAAAHLGETVLVVTHGGVLDIVNRFARALPLEAPRDFHIPNAGLNWLTHDASGVWSIETWGYTAHLETSLDEL